MNVIRNIWRSAPLVRTVAVNNFPSFRPLTSATVAPLPKTEDVAPPVELDKLYKRVELEMKGIDPAVLLSFSWFCVAAASHLGIEVTKNWALRKSEKERHTLLRFLHLQRLTGSTCDTYLEYIERNLPEGCALKVTKVECQKLPDHITPPTNE